MTAAVYVARKKLKSLIVSPNYGGQTLWASKVENYLGYQYITGVELMDKFKEQMKQFGIDENTSLVTGLKQQGKKFVVETQEGKKFESKTVVIASGKLPRHLEVPGEKELIGRGVSYCATCDGPLFTGKEVVVVGGGNSALEATLQLSEIAKKVHLVSRREWRADEIVQDKVRRASNVTLHMGFDTVKIEGKSLVSGLIIRDKKTKKENRLDVQGIFVEVGSIPVSEFASDLVEFNERGEIKVNCRAETSRPGVFAAGDVTDVPEKQIIIAAGDGAKAALGAYQYLVRR